MLSRELVDHGDIKTAYKHGRGAFGRTDRPTSSTPNSTPAGTRCAGSTIPRRRPGISRAIAEVADGPLSLSRAYYWLGRAAEAGGPGNAKAYYQKAAVLRHHLLWPACRRTDRQQAASSSTIPRRAGVDRQNFARREAVRAIRRLEACGYAARADILYRDLAEQIDSPGELALLAAMAEKRGNHFLALRVGKIAAARGLDIGALSHPVGVIPASANISGAGKALAYAIARQESEFNVGAVSGAGARGLLQLLPGTAKEVAKKAGLPYSKARLTTDAGYNATLGAAFLGEQLGRFDGSYVLTFAGYNAGPRRAQEWVKQIRRSARQGHRHGRRLDRAHPVHGNTSYVQRVMENYEVYKMRLSGKFDIVDDLVNGR